MTSEFLGPYGLTQRPFSFGDNFVAQKSTKQSPDSSMSKQNQQTRVSLRCSTTSALELGEIFTVIVGADYGEAGSFALHEDLACRISGFFRKAFSAAWKEKDERVIRLPEHDPVHFRLFVHWLYQHKIFSANPLKTNEPTPSESTSDPEWDLLAGAWTLGAYLQSTDFKDAVVDAIIDKVALVPFGCAKQTMHEVVYPKSLKGAPIRGLLVDIAFSRWSRKYVDTLEIDPSSAEFFRDLSGKAIAKRGINATALTQPGEKDTCAYHEHKREDTPCYRVKMATQG